LLRRFDLARLIR